MSECIKHSLAAALYECIAVQSENKLHISQSELAKAIRSNNKNNWEVNPHFYKDVGDGKNILSVKDQRGHKFHIVFDVIKFEFKFSDKTSVITDMDNDELNT